MSYKFIDFNELPNYIYYLFNDIEEEEPNLDFFQIIDEIINELAIEITSFNYRKTLIYGSILVIIANKFNSTILTVPIDNVTKEIGIYNLIHYIVSSPNEFHKANTHYQRFNKFPPNLEKFKDEIIVFNYKDFSNFEFTDIQAPFAFDYLKNLLRTYVNSFLKLNNRNKYSTEDISKLIISQFN
ncbi:hypothetical protein ACFVAD_12425 [Sutcliffiella sp. NPDC057660]|uniref:hypothetical protein n=1 Tax=Sutcliffiella sp. NPDC057660 TaxID=3346199 RepID=UPI00369DD830